LAGHVHRNESRSMRDTISRQRVSRPRRGIYGPPGNRTGGPLMAGEGGICGMEHTVTHMGERISHGLCVASWVVL